MPAIAVDAGKFAAMRAILCFHAAVAAWWPSDEFRRCRTDHILSARLTCRVMTVDTSFAPSIGCEPSNSTCVQYDIKAQHGRTKMNAAQVSSAV